MKKLLVSIAAILILCSAAKWWTDLTVNGSIIKTDPTYTGTLTISHTANNTIQFSNSATGPFLISGGNVVSSGNQAIASNVRGAVLSSTVAGVPAIQVPSGNVVLNQNPFYRTLIGSNIVDDGSTQLQTFSFKCTSLNMPTGAVAGYVLTSDASGNYTPQAPTGGGTGTTYTPTLTGSSGVSALSLQNASYIKAGNIVHVSITATYNCSTTGLTYIYFTLPVTSTLPSQGAVGFSGIFQSAQPGLTGQVSVTSTTAGFSNFYTSIAVSSGICMQFDYRIN